MTSDKKTSKLLHPFWSYSLVLGQFTLIGALFLISFPWTFSLWVILFQAGAVLLGLWALKTMHLGHFNIIPDPMPEIDLVTTGPYRFIRHPMYASILYFFAPVALAESQPGTWLLFLALALNLLLKLHYEEFLLRQKLKDYALYQSRSKKIIPYLF